MLKRGKKVDPFGFVALITPEGLRLRPKLTFRVGLDETLFQRKWPILQGPNSFQSVSQLKGVVYGQGLRILDTTASVDPECLKDSLTRLLVELKWVGYDDGWIDELGAKLGSACNRPLTLPMVTKELQSCSRMELFGLRAISDAAGEMEVLSQTFHDRLVPF